MNYVQFTPQDIAPKGQSAIKGFVNNLCGLFIFKHGPLIAPPRALYIMSRGIFLC